MQRVGQIVRMLDRAGRAQAGVTFVVRSAQGPVPEMAYVTGEDGCVRIGLPPGTTELEALAADGSAQRFTIDAADEPGCRHDLIIGGAGR